MKRPLKKTMTFRQLFKKMDKKQLNFDFPIQRKSGQWNNEQKALFIHTLIQGYDTSPIYMIDEETESFTKSSVIDGKQRLTVAYSFYKGEWKIDKKMSLPVELDGFEYDIQGMSFDEISEELQEELLDYSIDVRLLNGYTDDEIEEQFYRLNNGSLFTKAQKANVKLGTELANKIGEISEGNFFEYKTSFSSRQIKSAEPLSCVLQSMMLLNGFEYKNMSNNEVLRYSKEIGADFAEGKFSLKQVEYCKHLFDRLYALLAENEDAKKCLKKVNIPTVIMNLDKMEMLEADGEITEEKYKEFLSYWFTEGIISDDYVATCGAGSTSRAKTENRIATMENALLGFIRGE